MKRIILLLTSIIYSELCIQEEHPYEIAHSQELPYKVHCQNGIVNLSEYEWTLLRQSSKVIQDASDFHNNDDEEENNRIIIELMCIKRSTLKDLIHLLKTKASRSFYTLNRIHKLLLSASYLNIDPQITTAVIPHLKELLDSPDITTPIVKEILFSDYAQANRIILNQPIPITPCIKTLKGHSKAIKALTVWGQYLVSGSYDTKINLWDLSTNDNITIFEGHSRAVKALAVLRNTLVSGSHDTNIRLWDRTTGYSATLQDHDDWVVALTTWNNNLVSGSFDCTIKLWDISAFDPAQYTPTQNALMRILLKNKDDKNAQINILHDKEWKDVYDSLPSFIPAALNIKISQSKRKGTLQ